MDFSEYQRLTAETRIYRDKVHEICRELGVDSPAIETLLNMAYAGLGMGEAGETQGKLKKILRDSKGQITDEVRAAIAGELGDQLWYIAATAEEFGLDLGDIAQGNIDKLFSRKARGKLQGSGDKR